MKKAPAFGAVKPLPGQSGYGVTEAEILEREAKEMEARLRFLQERMKVEDESQQKSGSARWKSARVEKGSIRSYAKDIQEKHKKRVTADGDTKASAKGRRSARESEAGNFKSKTIDKWSVSDVGDWLKSMMLEQYISIFSQNEISGPVVLDISLEDLDYMGITILGHRKVILKGIEDLRKNKRVTIDISAPNAASNNPPLNLIRTSSSSDIQEHMETNSISTRSVDGPPSGPAKYSSAYSSSSAIQSNQPKRGGITNQNQNQPQNTTSSSSSNSEKTNKPNVTTTHWSQLEPLSSNKVPTQLPFANTADDTIDEAAERLAFQEAVEEWRRSNRATTPKASTDTQTTSLLALSLSNAHIGNNNDNRNSKPISELWENPSVKNPIASKNNNNSNNETKTMKGGKGGQLDFFTDDILGIEDPDDDSTAIYGSGDGDDDRIDSSSPPRASGGSRAGRRGSNSLLDGTLDEAKEHEDFKKAVQAWRSGSREGRGIADKLAKQMDNQYEAISLKLKHDQMIAQQKLLEANKQALLDRQLQSQSTTTSTHHKIMDAEDDEEENDLEIDDYHDEEDYNHSFTQSSPQIIIEPTSRKNSQYQIQVDNGGGDPPLSPASSVDENEWNQSDRNDKGRKGGVDVEVSLIESTMGVLDHLAENYYNVDEGSDED